MWQNQGHSQLRGDAYSSATSTPEPSTGGTHGDMAPHSVMTRRKGGGGGPQYAYVGVRYVYAAQTFVQLISPQVPTSGAAPGYQGPLLKGEGAGELRQAPAQCTQQAVSTRLAHNSTKQPAAMTWRPAQQDFMTAHANPNPSSAPVRPQTPTHPHTRMHMPPNTG